MPNTKKLIPKGQYGYTIPTTTWSDIGDVLNKGAEFILKGLEPIGKVFTSFASAPQHGATSYATTGQTKERVKQRNLENKAFEEKVGPALSPSNHVVAWTQGSFDPRVGQQKIAEWGPLAQLASVGADIAAFKYVPKGVNAAARTGKNYLVAREMSKAVDKGIKTQEAPQPKVRTRYGDVEIDNPQLAYRQGNGIIEDFQKTGKVRTPEQEGYGDIIVDDPKLGRFNFGKDFDEPMFAQGRLWYGLPRTNTGDLLVTAEPLALANKYSSRIKSSTNGTFDVRYAGFDNGRIRSRRVQIHEGQLTPENTTAYTWQPGYGYKKIVQEPSTIDWKTAQNVKLIADHNQWASQYGYKELPYKLSLSNRRTNKAVRRTIARHNSFYRGINPRMATKQDIQHYVSSLKNGEAPTTEGFIKFAATNPRSEGAGIFVSPFSANSSIYGNGSTNLVRRQYKLGKDRSQWFKQGDFEVQSIYDKQKNLSGSPVINPWEVIRSPFEPKINNGTNMANELILFDKLHYVGPRSYKAKGETTNKTNVTLWHE